MSSNSDLTLSRGRPSRSPEAASTSPVSRVGAAATAAAVAYAAAVLLTFPNWTVDDAFISFRYAENLALHGELTWNVGDDPVEGYTGVLLPLALAAGIRLGLDPASVADVLGIGAYLAMLGLTAAAARAMSVGPHARDAVVALAASAPILFTHATSGLETSLFSALLAASLLALVRAVDARDGRARREVALFVVLLALSLTRPEGAVAAVVAAVMLAGARWRSGRRAVGALLLRGAAAFLVPGAVYFAWRYAYYGRPLPNTYYAKLYHRVSLDSALSLAQFLGLYLLLPALACGLLVAASRGRAFSALRARSLGARLGALAAALVFALIAAKYLRSALIMNYSFRFWAPFYPLLLLGAAFVGSAAVDAVREAGGARGARRIALAAALAAVCLQAAGHVVLLERERRFARQTSRLLADEHEKVARYLAARVPEGGTIVVVVDAGVIPYYSRLRTIDFGGLNDEFLARRFVDRVSSRRIVDYFYSHDAAALVFTSNEWDRVVGPESAPITSDPRFDGYVLAKRFRSDAFPNYYQFVYLRRDLAAG